MFYSTQAFLCKHLFNMEAATQSKKRHSYTREYKLSVVSWYYENQKNVSKAVLNFEVDGKQVRIWIAQ